MPTVPPFYILDITDYGDVPDSLIKEAADEVADFVKTEILSSLSSGDSPVEGESFDPLSEKYAEEKHGGDTTPRLELSGDMLDALDVRVRGSEVEVFIRGAKQNDKASGHCQFPGGEGDLPRRRFIPFAGDGQRFKGDIESGIAEIVDRFVKTETEAPDLLGEIDQARRDFNQEQRNLAKEILRSIDLNVLPPTPEFEDL